MTLKTAGQNVLTPVGSSSFIGVGTPKAGGPQAAESSWMVPLPSELIRNDSDDSPMRCRSISKAVGNIGVRCRATPEVVDIDSGRCWTTAKSSHLCTQSRASNVSDAGSCPHKASGSTAQISHASPLPQSEVDWLMGTLRKEDLAKFESKFFANDCKRRFRELDLDMTGLLSLENLQGSLVDMFPTLQLDLVTEGHRIPAMHKSIPSLIATFDTDADGHLDFEDFVTFVKFQQAWRAQFFLSRLGSEAFVSKTEAHKGVRRLAPARRAEKEVHEIASHEVVQQPPKTAPQEVSPIVVEKADKTIQSQQGSPNERTPTDTHVDASAALLSPVKSSPAKTFRSSKRFAARKFGCVLDASRGAFYSSLASFSSTL